MVNPGTPFTALALRELRSAAASAQIALDVFEVGSGAEVSPALAKAAQTGAAGLIVFDDPIITPFRAELTRLAATHRLPALYADRLSAEAGGLVAYGPDRRENFRRAAEYVDKILKGARPADLPIEQSSKFDLVVNLRAAKALGFEIPAALLARADEVIE
jgi:putative ABC transport system substrate-binding protein